MKRWLVYLLDRYVLQCTPAQIRERMNNTDQRKALQ